MPPLVRWLPLFAVVLTLAVAVWLMQPPRPLGTEAPASVFAVGRALRDLAIIAREPHSLGTPANAAVHEYLVRRCRALGLRVSLQDTSVFTLTAGQLVGGRVQNIVARLPGRQPGGKAVLVLAHYDSQPHTPGAGDDGAGVAAMLETIRALRAGPPLAHDIIWLFTDGEEAGLLGARAYAADTARLRREVGVVLNFEGRGNRGPSALFEVNAQNGWVIREFARAAPVAFASSLFYEVYRNLPNDTDFTPLRQAGLTGLNFAYTDGFSHYHSPADTPAHLDLGSLQHQGAYMLSLVRHFDTVSLTQTKAPDYTFFNPIGHWLVYYPAAWNLPLTLLTLAVLLAVAVLARRRGRLGWLGLVGGAAAWVGVLLLMLAAGYGLLAGIVALYPQYQAFYSAAFYNILAYQVALLALGGAVFTAYYSWLGKRVRPDALVGGALLIGALLLGLVQWQAASSAFLLVFPLLFASLGWALRLRPAGPGWAKLLGGLSVLPAAALLVQYLYFTLIIFGGGPLVLVALLLLALLLGFGLPVLLPLLGQRYALPALALASALVALVVGHATSQPTAAQPQQTHLFYTLAADQGRAYWLSALPRPDAWTRQVLTRPHYGPLPAALPGATSPVLYQAAPRLALAPPQLLVLTDSTLAGQRHLKILVRPGRAGVRSMRLLPAGRGLQALRLAGHRLPLTNFTGPSLAITFYAPHAAGELLDLELATASPVQVVVTSRSLGLPPSAGLPPLSRTFVPAPGYASFSTQVKQVFTF
ncbi:M20/M25/M40 family metallo-hydrolase [Hymenobacter bucti]|uniref:Vacuolar membrane protease n=1 Tax=Hymenobacter bucti TaxID=1844114 RepID=A0ABW4QRQ1_9BACT